MAKTTKTVKESEETLVPAEKTTESMPIEDMGDTPNPLYLNELAIRDETIARQEGEILRLREENNTLTVQLEKIRSEFPTVNRYSTEIPEPLFKDREIVYHPEHVGLPFQIVSCGGVDRTGSLLYNICSTIVGNPMTLTNVPERMLSKTIV